MICICGQKINDINKTFSSRMGEPTYQSKSNSAWVCLAKPVKTIVEKGASIPQRWGCLVFTIGSCCHSLSVCLVKSAKTKEEAEQNAIEEAKRICFNAPKFSQLPLF